MYFDIRTSPLSINLRQPANSYSGGGCLIDQGNHLQKEL